MFRAGCSDAGSGAGATNEGKQKAFVPPPAGRAGRVPREVFRGKCRIPPAGFASRGRVVSPRRGTRRPPLGASGALPPRFARLRGRGLPRFCRLHHVGLLRPSCRNCPFPTRARDTRKISSVYSRAPDTKILSPPTHRENSVLPPPRTAVKRFRLYKPRAPHRETPVSDPRGYRAIIFHDAIPARYSK